MAIWEADLSTRMGAETATSQAGLACFILAGMAALGAAFFGGMAGFDTVEGMLIIAIVGLEALLAVIAGFRFRAGKGAFLGIVMAVILVLEMVNKLMIGQFGGLIINGVMLVIIVQGIRGAFALTGSFADDEIAAFE